MENLNELLQNKVLVSAAISWASAQILKVIIYAFINKKLDILRLVGDGGMPSGHSATVTGVAVATGALSGFDSPVFAVACIIAIVVMHDSSGVRLETGKQAKVLNELIKVIGDMGNPNLSPEAKLKEFVGHTHMQVVVGCCIGIVSTLLFLYL